MKKYVKDFIFVVLGSSLFWVGLKLYPDSPAWWQFIFGLCGFAAVASSIGIALSFIYDRFLVLFKRLFKVVSPDQEAADETT